MSFILRAQIIAIVFVFFIVSCKTELEKIDINNVEAHRAYQDTLINQSKDDNQKLEALKKLTSEYRALNKEDKLTANVNYNYYMARIYQTINDFAFPQFWIDSINKTFKNKDIYINYYDSTYYYSEKTLSLDSNHIRAMYLMSSTYFYEKNRYLTDTNLVPNSYKRNAELNSNRLGYIVNNAHRFTKIDTSSDRFYSRFIAEVALTTLMDYARIKNYELNFNDQNNFSVYIKIGELYDFIKGKESLLGINYETEEANIYPNVLLARNELKRLQDIALEEQRKAEERELKLKNIRSYGSQYIGTWKSDDMSSKLIIKNDGTYEVYYYGLGGSEGKGKWDCTAKSISFTKTSGDHVAFMFEAVYHSNTAVFEYYNIFAPTLCLNRSDGHVDFCYSHHNQ